jgi:hypothetical protein
MAHIYLDESGQFNIHNSDKYFVVASFIIGDPRRTAKQFRSWCATRFPRKMRGQSEIKWSASGIDPALRLRTLKHIAKLDVRIRYGYLLRSAIPHTFKQKDSVETGLLYTSIVSEILEMYTPIDEKELHIFCDQRHLKSLREQQFIQMIRSGLLPLCAPNTHVGVAMVDSALHPNIQIADWIVGALAHYLEGKEHGQEYFNILQNNILGSGKEFFKK